MASLSFSAIPFATGPAGSLEKFCPSTLRLFGFLKEELQTWLHHLVVSCTQHPDFGGGCKISSKGVRLMPRIVFGEDLMLKLGLSHPFGWPCVPPSEAAPRAPHLSRIQNPAMRYSTIWLLVPPRMSSENIERSAAAMSPAMVQRNMRPTAAACRGQHGGMVSWKVS